MKDFFYMSEQIHSLWEKGRGKTRRNVVQVRGKNGIKSVETFDGEGKQISRNEKKLTRKEMNCIKNNKFIPGLFKDCIEPLQANKRANKRATKLANAVNSTRRAKSRK